MTVSLVAVTAIIFTTNKQQTKPAINTKNAPSGNDKNMHVKETGRNYLLKRFISYVQ